MADNVAVDGNGPKTTCLRGELLNLIRMACRSVPTQRQLDLDQTEAGPGNRRQTNPQWFLERSKNRFKSVLRNLINCMVVTDKLA